jgi:hypothetical protein
MEWVSKGIVVEGNPDAKACFSVLTVSKTDDFGKETGRRLCINMGPGNKHIIVDEYPLLLPTEVLEVSMTHRALGLTLLGLSTKSRSLIRGRAFTIPGNRCKIWKANTGFFGVNILPSHFQRIEDSIARESAFLCRIYFDNAFNEGGTKEDDILQCVELIDLYTKQPYCESR